MNNLHVSHAMFASLKSGLVSLFETDIYHLIIPWKTVVPHKYLRDRWSYLSSGFCQFKQGLYLDGDCVWTYKYCGPLEL